MASTNYFLPPLPNKSLIVLFCLLVNTTWAQFTLTCADQYNGEDINCVDPAGVRVGTWIIFDEAGDKFSELSYDETGTIVQQLYFRKDGNFLIPPADFLDRAPKQRTNRMFQRVLQSLLERRKIRPKNGKGIAEVAFLWKSIDGISDIRLIKGLDAKFNEDLLYYVKKLEGKVIIRQREGEDGNPVLVVIRLDFNTQ